MSTRPVHGTTPLGRTGTGTLDAAGGPVAWCRTLATATRRVDEVDAHLRAVCSRDVRLPSLTRGPLLGSALDACTRHVGSAGRADEPDDEPDDVDEPVAEARRTRSIAVPPSPPAPGPPPRPARPDLGECAAPARPSGRRARASAGPGPAAACAVATGAAGGRTAGAAVSGGGPAGTADAHAGATASTVGPAVPRPTMMQLRRFAAGAGSAGSGERGAAARGAAGIAGPAGGSAGPGHGAAAGRTAVPDGARGDPLVRVAERVNRRLSGAPWQGASGLRAPWQGASGPRATGTAAGTGASRPDGRVDVAPSLGSTRLLGGLLRAEPDPAADGLAELLARLSGRQVDVRRSPRAGTGDGGGDGGGAAPGGGGGDDGASGASGVRRRRSRRRARRAGPTGRMESMDPTGPAGRVAASAGASSDADDAWLGRRHGAVSAPRTDEREVRAVSRFAEQPARPRRLADLAGESDGDGVAMGPPRVSADVADDHAVGGPSLRPGTPRTVADSSAMPGVGGAVPAVSVPELERVLARVLGDAARRHGIEV